MQVAAQAVLAASRAQQSRNYSPIDKVLKKVQEAAEK